MNLPAYVLRPEPGLSATLAAARARGLPAKPLVLAEVRAETWTPAPRDDFDALLLGSANALRHGGPALELYRGMPAMVVGEATADAARETGFDVIRTGTGGLQNLLDTQEKGRLLRLAGAKHVALTAPKHVEIITRIVYRLDYRPLPLEVVPELSEGAVILLHSAEMARHFAEQCMHRDVDRAQISIAAFAPRIAAAAGPVWKRVETARKPTDEALLELVRNMCQ